MLKLSKKARKTFGEKFGRKVTVWLSCLVVWFCHRYLAWGQLEFYRLGSCQRNCDSDFSGIGALLPVVS